MFSAFDHETNISLLLLFFSFKQLYFCSSNLDSAFVNWQITSSQTLWLLFQHSTVTLSAASKDKGNGTSVSQGTKLLMILLRIEISMNKPCCGLTSSLSSVGAVSAPCSQI